MESTSSVVVAAVKAGESGFLSSIIAQLWSHMNLALGESVRESVEPMFEQTLPHPLSTLRFTELDLGTVPIQIDNIIVHDIENNDSLQFDLDVIWDGDCNIQLKADYIGSFGVRQIKLKGRMSVLMSPITSKMPVVSAVQYGFINPPHLALDFVGLANVADFSMIDDTIRGIIMDTINNMMVLPNRMLTKMDPSVSVLDTYKPPIGVARVTIVKGSGFDAGKGFLSDGHDVYCKIRLGNSQGFQTTTQTNSAEPTWNERFDFLLFDYDQTIDLQVLDEDLNGDDDLGKAQVSVREVMLSGKTLTLDLHGGVHHKGGRVTLHCEICTLTSSNLNSLESNQDEHLLSGLATILVVGAQDIPLDKKEDASCLVKVKYGGLDNEFVTGTVVDAPGVDALNPVFDCAFHLPLTPALVADKAPIEFQLCNDTDMLGSTIATHEDLVGAKDGTITEKRKIGEQGASLEFRVSLHGVQPKGGAPPVDATTLPVTPSDGIRTVRLTVLKGWGFEAEKARFLRKTDIPDVYCNISFGSSPKIWKTSTVRNSTTPEWNESANYILSDHGQIIHMIVWDEDTNGQDDELGSVRIPVGKLLLAGGSTDVELQTKGKPTGQYIALRCDVVDS